MNDVIHVHLKTKRKVYIPASRQPNKMLEIHNKWKTSLEAYVTKKPARNAWTKKYEEPDENLLHQVEEILEIPEQEVDGFRHKMIDLEFRKEYFRKTERRNIFKRIAERD